MPGIVRGPRAPATSRAFSTSTAVKPEPPRFPGLRLSGCRSVRRARRKVPLVLTLILALSLAQQKPIKVQQDSAQLGNGWWSGNGTWATLDCITPVVCSRNAATGTISITSSGGGGGGAPTNAEYVTYASNASLSAERVLSAGNYTTVDLGTAAQAQVDWAHGLTCSAGQALTSSGTTAMACTSTLTASDVVCGSACVTSAEIVSVTGAQVSSAVATATALASNPTDCAGDSFAIAIDTGGNLTCSVAYVQIEDEGTPLTSRATLDFVGSGVTCVDTGGTHTTCTISSGGGTSPLILSFGGF